ncbi:MAG: chalcone isomerase family protein [Acidobacteriota bacterium]
MKSRIITTLSIVCMLGCAAMVAAQITEPKTGKTFDTKISLPGASEPTLRCVGAGLRTKFVVKVYAGSLYLDEQSAPQVLASFKGVSVATLQGSPEFYKAIITSTSPKAILMKFVRDVGKDKIREAYAEGLEKTLGEIEKSPLKADAEKFLAMFNDDILENDQIALFGKGSAVNVWVKGKEKGTVDNTKLAEAIWSIWLGPKPVTEDLKKGMVSQVDWAVK